MQKKVVFENGKVLYGTGFGANKQAICEVVCNTAMVGYQEVFSDNSYCGQFVCMTYPLLGGYGLAEEDYESRFPQIGGLIVSENNELMANFRASKTISEAMEEYGIPGIAGVDTRQITRMVRGKGGMRAILCAADKPEEEALLELKQAKSALDLLERASCKKRWYARTSGVMYNVVVVDCGVKMGFVRGLVKRHCNVTVLPYTTNLEEIEGLSPDGVLFSNGPGNPQDAVCVVQLAKDLFGKFPLFGIGLGHQIIALAAGCKTHKLPQGHHGSNHPVKSIGTGKITITTHAHNYAVEEQSVAGTGFVVTHASVLDGTVEGLECSNQKIFSAQFYPESSPGIFNKDEFFDKFISNMDIVKKGGRMDA